MEPALAPASLSSLLRRTGKLPAGGGDAAVLKVQLVSEAYRSLVNQNPYPLLNDLIFAPLGLIHDPYLRPTITILGLVLMACSALLLTNWLNSEIWLAPLSLPVLHLVVAAWPLAIGRQAMVQLGRLSEVAPAAP